MSSKTGSRFLDNDMRQTENWSARLNVFKRKAF